MPARSSSATIRPRRSRALTAREARDPARRCERRRRRGGDGGAPRPPAPRRSQGDGRALPRGQLRARRRTSRGRVPAFAARRSGGRWRSVRCVPRGACRVRSRGESITPWSAPWPVLRLLLGSCRRSLGLRRPGKSPILPPMPDAYRGARDHIDDELQRVALILNRQIQAAWEQGILPRIKDEFSGTFVSGGEVGALLVGGLPVSADGQSRIALIDAALATWGERIEDRLAASRAEGAPLPWDALRSAFRLSATEQQALWVLIAVEISSRHRQLARYLTNDAARVHSDVGLVENCVYSAPSTRELLIEELAADAPLFRNRILEPVGGKRSADDYPFLLRPLRVATRVIELAHGRMSLDREVAQYAMLDDSARPTDDWIGPRAIVEEIRGLLREAASAGRKGAAPATLVLVGPEGVGKRSLCGAVAQELGCQLLVVPLRSLPEEREELHRLGRAIAREAVLFRAIPVLTGFESVAEDPRALPKLSVLDAALADYLGPLVATTGARDVRLPSLARGAIRLDLELPSETDRVQIWLRTLAASGCPVDDQVDVDRIAARYPITGGLIERATAAAAAIARGRGGGNGGTSPEGKITEADTHAGLRGVLDEKMSALGSRVTRRQAWEDLVVTPETLDGIREFMARLKHRKQVYEQWGFARKLAKGLGVSALFAGPPGTGKTMVAGLISTELGLDLYQIDLSRIVSKFVGETEKNLAQVFDAAEAGHAILLFDEADSLFAKRTEVKSSVDRYANLEVNYLLQRMERFDGVTILTTNLESSMDTAFKRRLSFRIDFPAPEEDERLKLWGAMIPAEAEVGEEMDFEEMSRTYEMSGGNIRNAVLRAAFLAAGEGESLTMDHLRRAADLEYIAMGRVFSSSTVER
ncbi:MAG: ATP-binding protein [Myxococcales bacterium]|nr:ATP-binding protein [Myxococcales bacterium]